nr:hypothetical protein CTI12_AA506200 [Tanacetum cinerariifolium]
MYSAVSPWFVVLNRKQGIITCTDPLLAENYHMKNSKDLRKLPEAEYYKFESLCFSAPPTSVDCMVAGFTWGWDAHIQFLNQETYWRRVSHDQRPIKSLPFYGRIIYALCEEGELIVFCNLGKENYSWKVVEAEAPNSCSGSSAKNYLTKCNQHLLLVSVGERGKHVKVLKMNNVSQRWEKIEDVGKHMIFICDTTCLCIEAKMPQMENTIFFPRIRTKSRKMVFYSLDTCKYHTFDGENSKEYLGDFVGTKLPFSPNAWSEPT